MTRRIFERFLTGALCSLWLACGAHAKEQCSAGAIVHTRLAGVPAILRVPQAVTKPPIILWHGLGPPASEDDLMAALPLDEVPAVKVYLGLPLLGARAPAAGAPTLAQRQAEDYALRVFEPVVVGAARELPGVLDALRKRQCPGSSGKIGLFGFSAGGAAVLVALADPHLPVGAAVTINAPAGLDSAIDALERATSRPYNWSEAARQLAKSTDPVSHAREIATGRPPRALLLLHGENDSVISSADSVSLERALRPLYAAYPERLRLLVAPGISHGWAQSPNRREVELRVAEWFNRYL